MYVHMYVCIHVCTAMVCIYVCACVRMYVFSHVYTRSMHPHTSTKAAIARSHIRTTPLHALKHALGTRPRVETSS